MNRFNLIDEPWIPVADAGLVSLRDIFSHEHLRALGGTPLQKIALLKLFLAIVQAAATPEHDAAWNEMGSKGMAQRALAYLEKWHDAFYLYGDKPFLQMPAVEKAELKEYGAIMPEIATGNATVLTQWQYVPVLNDAQKALLLLVDDSCCFGGKKTDAKISLSPNAVKKSAKSGPALCYQGLLHSFIMGTCLYETVWLNLHTFEDIAQNRVWEHGLGVPPWEEMPKGELCPVAERLTKSLMGRLLPLARFCLLKDDGLHYVEGIQHPDYQSAYVDPSAASSHAGKKVQMLWVNPNKRPWRSLTALLSFLQTEGTPSLSCQNIRMGVQRLKSSNSIEHGIESFGIWSGGVRVSSNAGEQYLSGNDDMVESEISLSLHNIHYELWFPRLQAKMLVLEEIAKKLYGSVMGYYNEFKNEKGKSHAERATLLFWQGAESYFNDLLDACSEDEDAERLKVMKNMVNAATTAFDIVCPQDTARQMQSWAQHAPRLGKYLKSE